MSRFCMLLAEGKAPEKDEITKRIEELLGQVGICSDQNLLIFWLSISYHWCFIIFNAIYILSVINEIGGETCLPNAR